MIYQKELTRKEYYKDILDKLTFFKFSEFEIDILVAMLTSNMLEVNIDTREQIRKVLNKDKFITNNYIKRLREKEALLDKPNVTRVYCINPEIMDIIKAEKITFEYIINDNN